MDHLADMQAIVARLEAAGETVSALCREAGMPRSTWDRWARGDTEPHPRSWRRITAAADVLAPQDEEDAA